MDGEGRECRDDYRDIGGSECRDDSREGGGSESQEHILEHILEAQTPTWKYDCKDAGGRTTQETKSRWYDPMDGGGIVESGKETESEAGRI